MRQASAACCAAVLLFCAPWALAYRPFDSTDAAVAGPGEFELEFGPVGTLRQGQNRFWVAPAAVANVGLKVDRELVLQGNHELQRGERDPDTPSNSIVDAGVFIKQVLRRGVLQDESGASIATEYGFLLPGLHGDHGTGFSWAGIVSQRWPALTLHLNGAAALNREHRAEGFLGAIVEGPYQWPVRPVAEWFVDQASGSDRIRSRLVGLIWRKNDNLSFDIGVRTASSGGERINEARLGFTWAFELK